MKATARILRAALITSLLAFLVLPVPGSTAMAASMDTPETGPVDWTATENLFCNQCGAIEPFYIYVSPEGAVPGADTAPAGSHWRMTLCLNCGAVNGDLPAADSRFGQVSFRLEDCPVDHTEEVRYEAAEGGCHRVVGVETDVCPLCGWSSSGTEDRLEPHSFGAWTVDRPPTAEAEGSRSRTCLLCGAVEREALDRLEPAPVPDDPVPDDPAPVPRPRPVPNRQTEPAPETVRHDAFLLGMPDGRFAPDRSMTRAEAAVMLARLAKAEPVPDGTAAVFPDVPAGAWYEPAVRQLVAAGVLRGRDGRFAPEEPITRAELTALTVRLLGREAADTAGGFPDVPAGHWAAADICAAAELDWVRGDAAGLFRPEAPVTRAEAAALLDRALGREADRTYIAAHLAELTCFPDVGPEHWAWYPILEAANGHDALLQEQETWR